MFLPPKLKTIGFCVLFGVLLHAGVADAQQADFSRRMEAMQQARLRAQQPAEPVYVASNDVGTDFSAPPAPAARVAQADSVQSASPPARQLLGQSRQRSSAVRSRIPTQFRSAANRYAPQQMRTAQLIDETVVDSGSPIMNSVVPEMATGEIIGETVIDGGCLDGNCTSCGEVGGYFGDACCGRGGCPPGPCWLSGLGAIFRNGEYFGGATAFQSSLFPTPGNTTGQLSKDSSHGFYEGFNFGFPLCRLTCGVFSAQVGVRATQSNFKGNEFTPDTRNQLFFTTGFYRRVDYGIQMGVVVDYLRDDWFIQSELAQIRGDIGYVYPSGSSFGFRYAANVNDDSSTVRNQLVTTTNNYRFYYRCDPQAGGFFDGYIGWSEDRQTILGLDFDYAIRERLALQAGYTYFLNDEGVPANSGFQGGNQGEAYNFYVGLVLRPRGRAHYRSYDRALLPVADNGTMLIQR